MPVNPTAIVDAIVADLTSTPARTAGIPNARRQRSYAEPTVIVIDVCPLLAVWCERTDYTLLTGALNATAYERRHRLNVGWYVAGPNQADTGGTGDPATVQALETVIAAIVARVETWTAGIPGFSQLVATIDDHQVSPMEGSIWRGLIEFTVEEAA
jgi:hypothetical protein